MRNFLKKKFGNGRFQGAQRSFRGDVRGKLMRAKKSGISLKLQKAGPWIISHSVFVNCHNLQVTICDPASDTYLNPLIVGES